MPVNVKPSTSSALEIAHSPHASHCLPPAQHLCNLCIANFHSTSTPTINYISLLRHTCYICYKGAIALPRSLPAAAGFHLRHSTFLRHSVIRHSASPRLPNPPSPRQMSP